MKKLIFFSLIVFSCFHSSCTQNVFRNKTLVNGEDIIYILPPKSDLVLKKDGNLKRRTSYQSIEVNGLNTDYYHSLEQLNCAKYRRGKRSHPKISKGKDRPELIGDYCKVKWLGHSGFIIEIDFNEVIYESDVTALYNDFSKKLLVLLAKKEKPGQGNKWAAGIGQNIVEKVFEMMPVPEEASLARYICDLNSDRSFVMLNPKIMVAVDTSIFVRTNSSDWKFDYIKTNHLSFFRNRDGLLKQSEYFKFASAKAMPSNNIGANKVHMASSADSQFSSLLQNRPYVFLYQADFKQNNSDSDSGGCAGTLGDSFECNSQFWYFSTLDSVFTQDFKDLNEESSELKRSSFGQRTLMTPLICIYINGKPVFVPLSTTFAAISSTHALPVKYRIYRHYSGKYKRARGFKNSGLIAGDHIKF